MEIKNRKIVMPRYTKKELEELKSSLCYCLETTEQDYGTFSYSIHRETVDYAYASRFPEDDNIKIYIDIRGATLVFKIKHFFSLLHDKDKLVNQKLHKFIFDTEFKDVALYINDYPEIARWRLRIGK